MSEEVVRKIVFTWLPEGGLEPIRRRLEGIDVRATDNRAEMLEWIADADVACVGEWDTELLAAARCLRWVQALSGGVESVLCSALRESPIPLACCKECFAIPAAEHALAVMLAFSRRLEYDIRQRPKRTFTYTDPEELAGKRVGIIGMGNIGREIASRCRCFGMHVIGLARTPRVLIPEVDALWTGERLHELMAAVDFVVVAVPLTPATKGMIDEAALRQMKPTGYLIDISGRPALYDLEALTSLLKQGAIAGAGLQVVPSETSPLWDLDNLLISFHRTTSRQEVSRCFELFYDNVRRFQHGEPLRGLVDKAAGY